MSAREKWLVGLMIGALLYGGAMMLASAVRGRGAEAEPVDGPPDVHAFAQAAQARVAALRLTAEETAVLDILTGAWPASPFLDRADQAHAVQAKVTAIRYTGYFHIGAVKLAIINGREYRENEAVDATDLTVEEIGPDQVMLASKGGARRVAVALHEIAQHGEKP